MFVEAAKRCRKCNQDRRLSEFYRNKRGRLGLHSVCKPCSDKYADSKRARIAALGDARIPATKVCALCKECLPEAQFARTAAATNGLRTYCRNCDKVVRRSHKYGLTRDRVAEMLLQLKCEACGKALPTTSDRHVDHRHFDGAVRGILCDRCNTTLGKCDENPAILMALCGYLARTAHVDYRKQPYRVTNPEVVGQCSFRPTPPEAEGIACPTSLPQKPISQPQ